MTRKWPKEPWEYNDNEILSSKSTEQTSRKCKVCRKPILKVFEIEKCRKSGAELSKICIWDQYYTCGSKCQERWLKWQRETTLGISKRDENGVPSYKKIKDPYLDRYYRYGQRWGNALKFGSRQKVKIHDKETGCED